VKKENRFVRFAAFFGQVARWLQSLQAEKLSNCRIRLQLVSLVLKESVLQFQPNRRMHRQGAEDEQSEW